MRIACIHVPQLSLQVATRVDPALRGAALAIVGAQHGDGRGPLHSPLVLACSRAAWAQGVRLGMTAASARARAPEIAIVPAEPALEREVVRAMADALLGICTQVEVGARVGAGAAHLAMYAEVPVRMRGHAFGERTIELLEELGITARIGIADDRFTAWVAASQHAEGDANVVCVPRGGSAAFLAPRPLSLLAISPEVQHMLEALGVTTLGEFAALPAPSVARPFEADYQALARGEGGASLRRYLPDTPIREEIVVAAGDVLDSASGGLSGPAAIAVVARRVALRLAGRARGAARLEVTANGQELEVPLAHPAFTAEELARALAAAHGGAHASGARRLRVNVAGEAIAEGETIEIAAEGSGASRAAEASLVDPLALVLAKSGSDNLRNWSLVPPAPHREHRRTRRGKQRRARPAAAASAGQPKLFGDPRS